MKRLLLFVIINFQLSIIHSFAAQSAANTKLRVGYPSPSAAFYPLFATKEAGLLEKYGFDSEMVYVQGVKLVQVHVSGQLDISTVSSVVYLQASVGGADLIDGVNIRPGGATLLCRHRVGTSLEIGPGVFESRVRSTGTEG